MAEVDAMDSGQLRERIAASQVQQDHALRLRVLLVIRKARLDQQLIADESRRRVAGFADITRWALEP